MIKTHTGAVCSVRSRGHRPSHRLHTHRLPRLRSRPVPDWLDRQEEKGPQRVRLQAEERRGGGGVGGQVGRDQVSRDQRIATRGIRSRVGSVAGG